MISRWVLKWRGRSPRELRVLSTNPHRMVWHSSSFSSSRFLNTILSCFAAHVSGESFISLTPHYWIIENSNSIQCARCRDYEPSRISAPKERSPPPLHLHINTRLNDVFGTHVSRRNERAHSITSVAPRIYPTEVAFSLKISPAYATS